MLYGKVVIYEPILLVGQVASVLLVSSNWNIEFSHCYEHFPIMNFMRQF